MGRPPLQGRPQCTGITTINMYFLIEIRHNILIQCPRIVLMEFDNMLEIDISRNYLLMKFGVLRGDFEGLGVHVWEDAQTPFWLRL